MQTIRMKTYIKPFEKLLAVEELQAICGSEPYARNPVDEHEYSIPKQVRKAALQKLAYWEILDESEITAQVRLELTLSLARKTKEMSNLNQAGMETLLGNLPQSRCLRYGPHGLHEYRGKFFPQLVRSLINKSGIERGSIVFDPMCGSGTTLVEAASLGMRAVGMDMNPLSVLMTKAKVGSLGIQYDELERAFESFCDELERGVTYRESPWRDAQDEDYLAKWFHPHVIQELDHISGLIQKITDPNISQLFKISLSNILRTVSHQKLVDLRVRREVKDIATNETITKFRVEVERSVKSMVAFLQFGELCDTGSTTVLEHDARTLLEHNLVSEQSVDLVVTSPPYATALPYLDTDRLSLSYLGLLPRRNHRSRDFLMIGNREISEKVRVQQWQRYIDNRASLPSAVQELIEKIESENNTAEVGFRRKNLGALLSKYFFDMNDVLDQIFRCLKLDGSAYLVVGNNRTTTPVGLVEIETAQFLLLMAEKIGFKNCSINGMDMLVSRDIFKSNQTPSEHILHLCRQ